jgi:hypothetical protein
MCDFQFLKYSKNKKVKSMFYKKIKIILLFIFVLIYFDTNLQSYVWKDTESGLTWEVKTADNIVNEYTWQEAYNYCNNLILGGYSDWWLPSISQLRTLAHFPIFGEYNDNWEEWYLTYEQYKNNGFFIKYQLAYNMGAGGDYWAVSEKISSAKSKEDFSWYLDFDAGYDDWTYSTAQHYVRCVRAD